MPINSAHPRLRPIMTALFSLPALLFWPGCAAMKPSPEQIAKEKSERAVDRGDPPIRARGKSNLPFWYSSKSREIEENLGGS